MRERRTEATASLCSSISSLARRPGPKSSAPRVSASAAIRTAEHARAMAPQQRFDLSIEALGSVVAEQQQPRDAHAARRAGLLIGDAQAPFFGGERRLGAFEPAHHATRAVCALQCGRQRVADAVQPGSAPRSRTRAARSARRVARATALRADRLRPTSAGAAWDRSRARSENPVDHVPRTPTSGARRRAARRPRRPRTPTRWASIAPRSARSSRGSPPRGASRSARDRRTRSRVRAASARSGGRRRSDRPRSRREPAAASPSTSVGEAGVGHVAKFGHGRSPLEADAMRSAGVGANQLAVGGDSARLASASLIAPKPRASRAPSSNRTSGASQPRNSKWDR